MHSVANHVREYQSQLCNNFPTFRTLQRFQFQKAAGYKIVHGVLFMIQMHNLRRRHQTEKQDTPQSPHYINQSAAHQSNDALVLPGILTRNRLFAYTGGLILMKN